MEVDRRRLEELFAAHAAAVRAYALRGAVIVQPLVGSTITVGRFSFKEARGR